MKKFINNPGSKTEQPAATASLNNQQLLTCIVEKLAQLRCDRGNRFEKVSLGWNAIDTSSVEAYVDGYLNLSDETDLVNMPFVTAFLFTCYKVKRGNYSLSFCSSLS